MTELGCPACGRTLRIAEAHAGKQIRCPACQQICVAPQTAANTASVGCLTTDGAGRSATTWHVGMPDGPVYGPVEWGEVLAWAAEGRITADCRLARASEGPWQAATELIPHLPASGRAVPAAELAAAAYPWPPVENGQVNVAPEGFVAPHRGGLVLALGLLGFMACAFFSLVAWVMGSHDLREMRAGRMDRSGEGLTLAGMILGMIMSIVSLVTLFVVFTGFLIYAAARI